MIKKLITNIKNWSQKNPQEFWILVVILLISAFFRLYRISDYMTFLGDEGRDVIVVHRFITELHPPLIGPGTSVGNMYLGPLYYYMMAPALLLANFSPVGPAVQIAILGIITVWFIWYVFRIWFPTEKQNWGALIAAFLYAISPTVINFSRSSWNPNIMPFFALLSIYSIWQVYKYSNFRWLIVLGVSFACVLQSHYLGLLLAPTLFIFWLLTIRNLRIKSTVQFNKKFVINSIIGLGIFLLLMSPLLFFDLRHHFQNFDALKVFLASNKDIGFSFSTFASRFISTTEMLFANLIGGKNIYLGLSEIFVSFVIVIFLLKKRFSNPQLYLIVSWLLFGLLGLAYYKGAVYDHYLEFLFPIPFVLIGLLSKNILESRKIILKIFLFAFLVYLVVISILNNPPIVDPTFQLPRAISVAKVIQEKANGQRFNLASISDFGNRDVYEYFLLIWHTKIVDTDPSSLQFTITDQLFVVCEFPVEKCDPIHDSSAWITNFGWTKITDQWPVWGGTLFKLGHTK